MFWPFKKKNNWGNEEMIRFLYNWYLTRWIEDEPELLDYLKNKIPSYDEYNLFHNFCTIIFILSHKIHKLDCKYLLLEKILSDRGLYK